MTSKFESFDQSPLGAFIQSPLGVRGFQEQGPLVIAALSSSTVNDSDSLTIYGEGFLATQGGGFVRLSENSNGSAPNQAQTVVSWSDTEIDITVVQGSLDAFSTLFIYAENNNGDFDAIGVLVLPGAQTIPCEVKETDERFFEVSINGIGDAEITSPSDGDVFTTADTVNLSATAKSLVPTIFNSYPRFRLEGNTSGETIDFRDWNWQEGAGGTYDSTDSGENGLAQIFSDGEILQFTGADMGLGDFTIGESCGVLLNVNPFLVDVTSDIQWSSDIDGVLGSGGTVNTSSLSSGQHTIRARVDWDDHPGVDLIIVNMTVDIDVGIGITSVNPASGGEAGGVNVTITGFGYDGNTTVTFDGNPATNIVINSNTELTCDTPSGSVGNVDVVVSNGTDNDTLVNGFEYIDLTISNVSPSSGSESGGTSVTVTGDGFTDNTGVNFDGNSATNVVINSATEITCDTPSGTPGDVDVQVVDGAHTDTLVDGFTYQSDFSITNVDPSSGPTAGGTSVTVTGTGLTSDTIIEFGTRDDGFETATNITFVSSTEITCDTPAWTHGAGSVDVRAQDTVTMDVDLLADGFTYT